MKIKRGSIEIKKMEEPVKIGKHTFRYEVEYVTYPYGTESPMLKREREFAEDIEDAKMWKKTLMKEVV